MRETIAKLLENDNEHRTELRALEGKVSYIQDLQQSAKAEAKKFWSFHKDLITVAERHDA